MTILVAVKKNGRVFCGADRMTTFGNEYATDLVNGSKIIKLKHGYVATTGYSLLDNVIEHLYKTNSKLVDNTFADRHEVFGCFLALYNEMKKSYTLIDSGKETYANFHNAFLVVTAKSIFGISSNLSVHEYDKFAARGAGSDYSLGCLYGCYDLLDDGFEIARMALEAACRYSIYCKEPLDILEVKESDFGKKSKKGHKSTGRALSTLFHLKGIGHLIAVHRSPVANGAGGQPENAKKAGVEKYSIKSITTTAQTRKPALKSAGTERSKRRSKGESGKGKLVGTKNDGKAATKKRSG
jgi:ATP-dependent protease HslVU (ClpYQ) peptidase subunit